MKSKINSLEAYLSMVEFLDGLYTENQNDTLGSVLGDLEINLNDFLPMDESLKKDWIKASGKRFGKLKLFTFEQAYQIMIEFLGDLSTRRTEKEFKRIIEKLKSENNKDVNFELAWYGAIKLTLEKDFKIDSWL